MIQIKILKALNSANGQMNIDLDLTLESASFTVIKGISGAGKTSVLRMLAGFMTPEKGRIKINGDCWFDHSTKTNLKPQKREAGIVFQDYALFPNMTVFGNLAYALPNDESDSIILELLDVMDLKALSDEKPDRLSGGQKQRVALARALVQKPKLLLLDEPLSALDPSTRFKLQDYILKVHRDYNLTTIMVTHDFTETLRMADQVIEIDQGKVIASGKPSDVLTSNTLSGKFQFTGEIMSSEPQDVISIISVLVGNQLVKVVVEKDEAENLQVGDKVIVASKAFNPIIQKIS